MQHGLAPCFQPFSKERLFLLCYNFEEERVIVLTQKMIRVLTIIGIAIITTGVLLGSNLIYNKLIYTNPLEASVRNMPSVGDFQVEKLNSRSKIRVQFNVEKKLKSSFYHLLDHLESQALNKTGQMTLEISNQPDENLNRFLLEARLPIQEALSTGQFTVLPAALKLLADKNQVKYDLEVDNYFVFITVAKGTKSAHLVINRGNSPLNVVNTMGGEYL